MSDTTITFCGNIMLTSVKMHFSGKPKFWGFKISTYFFKGFRIHFGFQTDTLEIEKNHFSQKRK